MLRYFTRRLRLAGHLPLSSQTELATIWIAAWAIREPGILDPAASRGLAASLPLGSQQLTDAMVAVLKMFSGTFFFVKTRAPC